MVPFKATQLTHMANLWKPLDTMETELCTITCANVQFTMQRQVVKFNSRYRTLSINTGFKCSNQLPLENSNVLSTVVPKRYRLSGQGVVMLMNENFGPSTV